MKPELFIPSNSTEGMWFMSCFCENCIHENPDPDEDPTCDIITLIMCLKVDHPEYPQEWIYDKNDQPTCTKFKYWNWDDGPPPPPKYPDNPNQLLLFGYGPQQGKDSEEPGKTDYVEPHQPQTER